MKKRILHFLFCIAALSANAQADDPDLSAGARISFASLEHDYGTIANGANGECAFTYTNTGTGYLIITSCKSSCGCVVAKCDPGPLAPGKSAMLRVKYDTKRSGPFTKSVTVESNATNAPIVVLRIKGQVLAQPVEIIPANTNTEPAR